LERQGVESPKKLGEQGIKRPGELSAQGIEIGKGIKTLNNKKTLSIETLRDVIKQDFGSLDLDDDGTCFKSMAEKTFTPEDLSTTTSTLFLNSKIVDLKQQVHDLEALNQVMKEHNWKKQSEVESLEEVKRQKKQVKVWKYRASKCY